LRKLVTISPFLQRSVLENLEIAGVCSWMCRKLSLVCARFRKVLVFLVKCRNKNKIKKLKNKINKKKIKKNKRTQKIKWKGTKRNEKERK
jgi:hypothetical protein